MTIGRLTYETQQAVLNLKEGKRGDVITHSQMKEIIGGKSCWEAKSEGYRHVSVALNICIRDHQVFWVRDPINKQWLCGTVDDVIKGQQRYVKKAARSAGKSLSIACCVETEEMNQEQRDQHKLQAILAGLQVHAANSQNKKYLENKRVREVDRLELLHLLVERKDG